MLGRAFDWDVDDQRLAAMADRLVDYLRNSAAQAEADTVGGSEVTVAALLDAQILKMSQRGAASPNPRQSSSSRPLRINVFATGPYPCIRMFFPSSSVRTPMPREE